MFLKVSKSCDPPFFSVCWKSSLCWCVVVAAAVASSAAPPFLQCLSPPRFTLSIGYYGLSLNGSKFHPNLFISSFLSAAVEVPAYVLIWLALRYCRRKVCFLTILLVAAASLLVIPLVPKGRAYKGIFGTIFVIKPIRIATMTHYCYSTTKLFIFHCYVKSRFPSNPLCCMFNHRTNVVFSCILIHAKLDHLQANQPPLLISMSNDYRPAEANIYYFIYCNLMPKHKSFFDFCHSYKSLKFCYWVDWIATSRPDGTQLSSFGGLRKVTISLLSDFSKKIKVYLSCRASRAQYDSSSDWQRRDHSRHLHDLRLHGWTLPNSAEEHGFGFLLPAGEVGHHHLLLFFSAGWVQRQPGENHVPRASLTPCSPSHIDLFVKHLPYFILGGLSAISAAAVVFLPETFGKDLPQTIEQMAKVNR